MTRWILQGKADEPWYIRDTVGDSDRYRLVESGMEELGDDWSVEVERGSVQNQKIPKR
jgi:hypothetical protein